MAVDFGWILGPLVILWLANTVYKKKTGNPISTLWKNAGTKAKETLEPGFQRVYITKGVKQ